MPVTLDHVRAALELPDFDEDRAREKMGARPRPIHADRSWREGAVLILLYPGGEGLDLVLTRRTDNVEHHRGQISFPGGARESGESLLLTALRETEEEIGVSRESLEVIGDLPMFRIPPSAFVVRPYVAAAPQPPRFRPDPSEVAEVLEVPLDLLMDPRIRREEDRNVAGRIMRVPFFDVPELGEPPLWGATAMMLSGLLERIRAVLEPATAPPPRR
jgi:8-oxo-dGTP pyrophosphatase MutT (NUDIX family)